jgi:uncharacterized glyoxalase superfamily protein PhnB
MSVSSRPVFDQVNIVSADTEASVAFYRKLGLDIPEERVWSTATGAHHISAAANKTEAILDIDSTKFAAIWNAGWKGQADLAGRVLISFRVGSRDEVDRLHGEMTAAGYRSLQAPYDAFWGSRFGVIEDPDGIAVGLMSPRSDDKRSEAPEV